MSRSKDTVSNKKTGKMPRRPYRLKERAKRLEENRLRITEALVELHRTVGPARTTVSEVAQRAGVRRMTVYNHFPTELAMIDACSSHWIAGHPPPDPGEWTGIPDPGERERFGLESLYAYYRDNRDMVGNFMRDAPLVPALAEILERKWLPGLRAMADALLAGHDPHAARRPQLRAAVLVALDFGTWRTLADAGLDDPAAARLAADMIAAAAGAE